MSLDALWHSPPPPPWKAGSFTAKELQSIKFPPISWIVPNIIPAEGVTLLCSKPKFGKSLFAYDLCIACTLDPICGQNIGKNRLIAMFGRRLGRLQRQCHYAFIALGGEARTSELAEWCRSRLVILERGKPTRVQIASHARAARSIGACRVRRVSGQWVWRLTHTELES